MHFLPEYTSKLTDRMRKLLWERSQKYSRRGQYYSHAYNPNHGQKLPFFVKLPKISKMFDELDKGHRWADHRPGIYNGLYYVSHQPDTSIERFEIPKVEFGGVNFLTEFKKTDQYNVLLEFLNIYDTVNIDEAMVVSLNENQGSQFATKSSLKQAGNYIFIIPHII